MAKRDVPCCRLWLPQQLCVRQDQRLAIVGWINEGVEILDLVVVGGVTTSEDFYADVKILQRSLDNAESKLQAELRAEQKLRVIGEYRVCDDLGNEKVGSAQSHDLDRELLESLASIQHVYTAWALFSDHLSGGEGKKLDWVPRLYRIIRHDRCVALLSTHIIVYNQPQFGSHHLSHLPWNFRSNIANTGTPVDQVVKPPVWISTLEQQKTILKVEMIMQELNCARYISQTVEDVAASVKLDGERAPRFAKCSASGRIASFEPWRRVSLLLLTLWATALYCLARVFIPILSVWLPAVPLLRDMMRKSMLLHILRIRCQQLMAWPFVLLWGGLGPEQPNVAKAHRIAKAKHSTWFSLLIDMIAGAIVGFVLLYYHSPILSFLVDSGKSLTNDILRTGCVWLMGVPAGFKINTELAAVFGTLSLHWIQTWSTLLFTAIPAIKILLYVLSVSGIILGFTVLAAMVSDMVTLATIHVLSLHYAIAFIYSNQLRALAALFRLFRGRKRNVLRGRLDSFDCSVDQLLVGSLMFTPLLLLLPTTSVFYTFFSIIFLTVSSLQLIVNYVISVLLSFPFFEVATWFLHPKQFPSGVWMRIVQIEKSQNWTSSTSDMPSVGKGYQGAHCSTSMKEDKSKPVVSDYTFHGIAHAETEGSHSTSRIGHCGQSAENYSSESTGRGKKTTILFMLEIRTARYGEILRPFIATHFFGVQWPSAAALVYKVVSGERFSQPPFVGVAKLPHSLLSPKSFAKLCYTSMRR
ncbi:hypothetical protein Mp_1g13180 [Marchantia polymorpha subsp. ruderalis]|uniref:Uncharacterized protein n=2 Tax=Marchantia polymorpha TaxID=3197 RepID=A0AAF6APM8_MARPO|nr:hypothetical protein MARPO_0019s0088 [Marchantia polymorpha]BBM98398.1 hypothetical protein Mp_1g13180 [Marchantia polymorpha subsp. ruderalis]|eukprot:PTQ44667.1 hypothetical protein MARPO_0019s0088 [Marchantia polymorpha]